MYLLVSKENKINKQTESLSKFMSRLKALVIGSFQTVPERTKLPGMLVHSSMNVKKYSRSHYNQILCSRFCLTGDLNVQANTFTGFHNWYQFLLEQDRNPTQTTNIAFNYPRPFVGNKLVSHFIQSGNIYQKCCEAIATCKPYI